MHHFSNFLRKLCWRFKQVLTISLYITIICLIVYVCVISISFRSMHVHRNNIKTKLTQTKNKSNTKQNNNNNNNNNKRKTERKKETTQEKKSHPFLCMDSTLKCEITIYILCFKLFIFWVWIAELKRSCNKFYYDYVETVSITLL